MVKIINLAYTNQGGAGGAVNRINQVLNSFCKSHFISLKGSKNENSTVLGRYNTYFLSIIILSNLRHLFYKYFSNKYFKKYNYYNYNEKLNYFNTNQLFKKFPFTPDILIVHYCSHFINFKMIYEIQKKTNCKVIFNLLDTSFLTGGCHYSWDCKGFEFECKNCPAIKSIKKKNDSNKNFKAKQKYLNKTHSIVNVSSTFALNQVKRSSLFKNHKKSLIYYPIPNLRLESESYNKEKIIFLGTQDFNDKRKGISYFIKAINLFKESIGDSKFYKIQFRIAGNKKLKISYKNFKYLGYLDEVKLAKEYSKADLFICPSIEDNGPMMINEALSYGTPVVAFDVGISRDLIHKGNGYIAKNKDAYDLSEGIKKIITNKQLSREQIIIDSRRKLSYSVITRKWKKLIYDTL